MEINITRKPNKFSNMSLQHFTDQGYNCIVDSSGYLYIRGVACSQWHAYHPSSGSLYPVVSQQVLSDPIIVSIDSINVTEL